MSKEMVLGCLLCFVLAGEFEHPVAADQNRPVAIDASFAAERSMATVPPDGR